MAKVSIKKIKNVECYDFESKTNIPYDQVVEVEETSFIRVKIDECILERVEVDEKIDDIKQGAIDTLGDKEKGAAEEITTKGGDKDDSGKGTKSKKES